MALPNFSQYVVPGTYWEALPTPVAGLSSSTASVVGIIGPGIGYRTNTETDILTGTTAVDLAKEGINNSSVVVTSLDGSITYSSSSDYTLATVTGTGTTKVLSIARQAGSTIPSGNTVVISYQYTDASYGNPAICTSLQTVQSLFGNAFDITTGNILSPVSFAAQFAISNGASQVVVIATPNPTVVRADLTNAYALLNTIPEVNIVVPLPVGMSGTQGSPGDIINVAEDLSQWLSSSESASDILRIGIVGYDTTESVNPDAISNATAYKRVVEAWPNQMNWYNGYTNTTQVVGGHYLAAAYAGILAGNPPQQGLTRKIVNGFSGIPSAVFQTMTTAYKNQLSAAGVAVAEISRGGVLWCRHGTTTDPSSIYHQEISLVRAQDALVQMLEGAVEQSAIIGTPIGPDTVVNIQAMVIGILQSAVTLGVIEAYSSVVATQLTQLPTEIQVTFQYQPSYPLNYVTFVFSVNTTTGAITAGTATGQTG